MHQQLPVAHLGAGLWCCGRWWYTLFAGGGVRMFLWGQRPWKHQCADRLWTTVLSQGFWLIRRVAEEQFQQCYQEQTEGDEGPSSSAGAPWVVPMPPGCDSYSWIDSVWCGLCFCLPTCVCVCVCVHFCTHVCLCSQLGWRELCFRVYPIIENLSSTTLNCWLIWPCRHSPFVFFYFHHAAFQTYLWCKCFELK